MLCLDIHLCGVLLRAVKPGFLTKNTAVDAHTSWPHENPSPTEKNISRLGDYSHERDQLDGVMWEHSFVLGDTQAIWHSQFGASRGNISKF